jgi:hypothetical protein
MQQHRRSIAAACCIIMHRMSSAQLQQYKVQQFRCYRRGLTMYTAVGVC